MEIPGQISAQITTQSFRSGLCRQADARWTRKIERSLPQSVDDGRGDENYNVMSPNKLRFFFGKRPLAFMICIL
jgi:hypothetical protein